MPLFRERRDRPGLRRHEDRGDRQDDREDRRDGAGSEDRDRRRPDRDRDPAHPGLALFRNWIDTHTDQVIITGSLILGIWLMAK